MVEMIANLFKRKRVEVDAGEPVPLTAKDSDEKGAKVRVVVGNAALAAPNGGTPTHSPPATATATAASAKANGAGAPGAAAATAAGGESGDARDEGKERLRVCFLKGYPPWPCEVIPQRHVKKVLPESISKKPGKSTTYLPVQFFGTLDFGWVKETQTKSLRSMEESKLRDRNKKNQRYQRAVQQSYAMLEQAKAKPTGWWNGPKPPPPASDSDNGAEGDEATPKPKKERNAPNKGVPSRLGGLHWPKDTVLWHPHKAETFRLPELLEIRAKPRYDPLRRNLYSGVEAGSWPKPKRLPKEDILVCMCAPGRGCGSSLVEEQETCINRRMFVRCCAKLCPCGKACRNKEFNLLKMPKLRPFLTKACGWGVRTKERIPKGAFVVEYVGEVVSDAECERRMWEAKSREEKNFYMMEISADKVIDARHKANISRLINSSCQPNCRSQKCVDASTGEVRVGIFALRDIEPNEELSYNYQFQHFAHEEELKTSFGCRCGAPNCIGTLDSTVKKREQVASFTGKMIRIKWTDGKFHLAKICGYNWQKQKYAVEYESGGTEEVNLDDPKGKIKYKFVKKPSSKKNTNASASASAKKGKGGSAGDKDDTIIAKGQDGKGDEENIPPKKEEEGRLVAIKAEIINPKC